MKKQFVLILIGLVLVLVGIALKLKFVAYADSIILAGVGCEIVFLVLTIKKAMRERFKK
ncbi:hypothetical protein [Flavobacterium sp. U410]|jgi:uncharacterized membrane protein